MGSPGGLATLLMLFMTSWRVAGAPLDALADSMAKASSLTVNGISYAVPASRVLESLERAGPDRIPSADRRTGATGSNDERPSFTLYGGQMTPRVPKKCIPVPTLTGIACCMDIFCTQVPREKRPSPFGLKFVIDGINLRDIARYLIDALLNKLGFVLKAIVTHDRRQKDVLRGLEGHHTRDRLQVLREEVSVAQDVIGLQRYGEQQQRRPRLERAAVQNLKYKSSMGLETMAARPVNCPGNNEFQS